MRTALLSLAALLALAAFPACSANVDDEALDDSADELSANPNAGFFIVTRQDFRKCMSPICGGVFVKRVNDATTRCADGKYAAEQTYTITVAAGLKDSYGQRLAAPWTRKVRFEHLPTSVEALVESQALVEKSGRLALPLRLVNVDSLTIDAYRLSDAQLRRAI